MGPFETIHLNAAGMLDFFIIMIIIKFFIVSIYNSLNTVANSNQLSTKEKVYNNIKKISIFTLIYMIT